MKIALSQLNYTIGDLEGNIGLMCKQIDRAEAEGAELIVFSELSICGYIPKDKLNYNSFIERCEMAIEQLARYKPNIGVIIGAPLLSGLENGKHLRNAALLLHAGKIQNTVYKTLLPTYDIFDEYRYFEPNTDFHLVHFKGVDIALTICEDLWNLENPGLYPVNPMDKLAELKPDLMINISGSPYSYNHVEDRRERMTNNARHYGLPLIYVNQVGANTEILFDGGSLFIDRHGNICEELSSFVEDFRIVNWNGEGEYSRDQSDFGDDDMRMIHEAIVMGVRDYFEKMGFKKALLGSSGGIDSALVNAIAVEALGADRVHTVMMPSKFSSEGSVTDAVELAKNLGCTYEILPIQPMVDSVNSTLIDSFTGKQPDVTEENIQARSRGLLLMAISNKFGHILLNTSNKSETAVGYATLYGDMCGGLSPIGDLYKTQVYEMARYINRNGEIIPEVIITKAPSAELRPDQKDSDSLPQYDLLDRILALYIEEQKGWQEIVRAGYDAEVVRKVVKLVDRNEYKRFQAAPILRISHRAFGFGRQMPLVAHYYN
ncbi:MAG: NAD+ synthase [Bacteroidetes bacterium]|nr:NAD+ synthase [Bacteroidota bacterium]